MPSACSIFSGDEKKMFKKLILAIIALVLLASCATETDIDAVNDDGSPIWTTIVPESNKFVYGVGRAKLSTEANSTNSAEANARADLARKLQSTIKEATTNYTIDTEGELRNAYEQITMQVVNFTIQGVKTEQHWTAPDGTVWALVSIEAKSLDDQYALAANDYLMQIEKKKADTESKLADLLATLEEKEEDTTAIKEEAQKQASSLIAEYDNQLKGINVEALAKAIDTYTTSLGYV